MTVERLRVTYSFVLEIRHSPELSKSKIFIIVFMLPALKTAQEWVVNMTFSSIHNIDHLYDDLAPPGTAAGA
jgi:hypothetical protein